MSKTTTPRRRLLTTGIIGGVLLAVAVPAAASAHVTVTPDAAVAGSYTVLTFAFGHGCDGSSTSALTIDIPDEGIDSVTPQLEPGWTIEAVGAESGIASQVTGFVKTRDGVAATGVALVRLKSGVLPPVGSERRYLIFARHLKQATVDKLARNYVIDGLQLQYGDGPATNHVDVVNPLGDVLARLVWRR